MNVQLYLGDCLEVMRTIPDASIDCVIADPPYEKTGCKWDSRIPLDAMWSQLRRVIRANGAIVLFGMQPFTSVLVTSNLAWFKYAWVWDKNYAANFFAAKRMPLLTSEDICVFSPGGANNGSKCPMIYNPVMELRDTPRVTILNRGVDGRKNPKFDSSKRLAEKTRVLPATYPKSVIRLSNANHNERFHPTQKPVALIEYLIRTYTNAGDTVLDFCAGSGTTGVACVKTGRNFIGCEISPEYFAIAERRIEQAQWQLPLLEVA